MAATTVLHRRWPPHDQIFVSTPAKWELSKNTPVQRTVTIDSVETQLACPNPSSLFGNRHGALQIQHHHSSIHLSLPTPSMVAKFAMRSLNMREHQHVPPSNPPLSSLAIILYQIVIDYQNNDESVCNTQYCSFLLLSYSAPSYTIRWPIISNTTPPELPPPRYNSIVLQSILGYFPTIMIVGYFNLLNQSAPPLIMVRSFTDVASGKTVETGSLH